MELTLFELPDDLKNKMMENGIKPNITGENKVGLNRNNKKIEILSENTALSLEDAEKLFALVINPNPNSRLYSIINRGALLNFNGGLFGYENDHLEEALDLGCNHIVGHRPTILQQKKILFPNRKD